MASCGSVLKGGVTVLPPAASSGSGSIQVDARAYYCDVGLQQAAGPKSDHDGRSWNGRQNEAFPRQMLPCRAGEDGKTKRQGDTNVTDLFASYQNYSRL